MSEKNKNGQIKALISTMWLILLNTVQLIITKLCTKFQVVPVKSLTEKKLKDRYTNIVTEMAKQYTPYIFRMPGYNDDAVVNVAAVVL